MHSRNCNLHFIEGEYKLSDSRALLENSPCLVGTRRSITVFTRSTNMLNDNVDVRLPKLNFSAKNMIADVN